MRTVAITGITGKSGRCLLERMISEAECLSGYKFIFLCRKQGRRWNDADFQALLHKASGTVNLNWELAEVDLSSVTETETYFKSGRVDILLHIAGVKLSWNIVSAALKYGVNDFILVHTTGIYSKYKAAGEEYRRIESELGKLTDEYRSRGRSVALTILRPTMIYGDLADKNISVFIKMVDHLRIFPLVNGARYDLQPVWCKDLGNAFFDVLTKWETTRNKEYILSGGAPIQLRRMLEVIANQLGVRNCFISCPFFLAYLGAWFIYLASFGKVDIREKVQRLVEPRAYPHEAATRDFGYSPVPFEIGVREEIKMYRNSKGASNE